MSPSTRDPRGRDPFGESFGERGEPYRDDLYRDEPYRDEDGRLDQHDPVADFFRAQREDITPLPADDLRWQRIAREGRGARRPRGRWQTIAATAAAAAVVGGVVVAQQGGLLPDRSSSVAPASDASTAQVGQRVPAGFDVGAVTQARKPGTTAPGPLHALGSGSCAGATTCPVLATSTDGGRSWRVAAVFPQHTVLDRADASARPTPRTLSEVVFADDLNGWVYGGALLRTTDGGRTWSPAAHPVAIVLAVEATDDEVAVAAVDECGARACGQAVLVRRAELDGTVPVDVRVPTTRGDAPVQRVDLGWHDGNVLVSGVVGTDRGPQGMQAASVSATGAATPLTAIDEGCPNSMGLQISRPAGEYLYARCSIGSAAGSADLSLVMSADGGRTWDFTAMDPAKGVPANALVAPSDDQHVVAASPTSYVLQASRDGGATFAAPTKPPAARNGWVALRHEAGGFLAVPRGERGVYYLGSHDGLTWRKVQVAGAP